MIYRTASHALNNSKFISIWINLFSFHKIFGYYNFLAKNKNLKNRRDIFSQILNLIGSKIHPLRRMNNYLNACRLDLRRQPGPKKAVLKLIFCVILLNFLDQKFRIYYWKGSQQRIPWVIAYCFEFKSFAAWRDCFPIKTILFFSKKNKNKKQFVFIQ